MIDLQNPESWTAGRELDAAVAEAMGHWYIDEYGGKRAYINTGLTTTGDGMLLMVEFVKEQKFSDRQKVAKLINRFVSASYLDAGSVIAWPDIILFLTPLAVAKALLMWAQSKEGDVR